MSARQQRLADLIQARDRITTQIRALSPGIDVPDADPLDHIPTRRLADLARHMVHHGATHAEAAHALHVPTATVTRLIAATVHTTRSIA